MKTNPRGIRSLVTLLALGGAWGCQKKDKDDDDASETAAPTSSSTEEPAPAQADDVAGVYASVSTQIALLQMTEYESAALNLTAETWTADDWGTETRFNCYNECNSSITAKEFVGQALDPEMSGPLGSIHKKLDVFCYVGSFLSADDIDADGLPKIVADHVVDIDDEVGERLTENCGMSAEDAAEMVASDGSVSVTVEDVAGDTFDRLVTFAMTGPEGTESYPFYIKNSDGIISVAMSEAYEHEGSPAYSRSLFKFDLKTKEFRFEDFGRVSATGSDMSSAGSFGFGRGYYNGVTKEVAFLSVMGSDNYLLNSTFLALSGNEAEAEAGAYLARTSDNSTALDGAFVCFDKADGTFINATGCTENATLDRKVEWGPDADLFTSIRTATSAEWALGVATDVASFDHSTITTVEPNYTE